MVNIYIYVKSGQIIATARTDLGPQKGSKLEGKSPAILGKSRLVNYCDFGQ